MSPLMSPRATRGMAVLLGVVLLAGSALALMPMPTWCRSTAG